MTGHANRAVREPDNEAGFTLVEVLVALALFTLLVMLLFDNVRFGLQAWQHGSAHAGQVEQSLVSQDLLRRLIGNIYPMLVPDSATQPRIDFEGSRESLSFLGNAPLVASGGGRFRFKILAERHHDRTDLIMNAAPELADPQDLSMTRRTLVLSDVGRAEFAYSDGTTTQQGAQQWNDGWMQRSELPRLVRIRVAFRSGDARQWPDLLIAPRIAADVGCVYDAATKRCRGR